MEDFTARVLVYDSDPDQRLRIIGRLGDRGYSNLIARSVDEALDIARTNQLDIIIVNASVPKKEQESLNAALKDLWETRHLPIIGLIGGDSTSSRTCRCAGSPKTKPARRTRRTRRSKSLADFLPRDDSIARPEDRPNWTTDLRTFSHLSSSLGSAVSALDPPPTDYPDWRR